MGLIYLADTNVVSEMMRAFPNQALQAKWEKNENEMVISSITWHELLTGIYRLPRSKRRTGYENFLHKYVEELLRILPYDQTAAKWHASERTRLIQLGKTPSYIDGQIAAIAVINDLVLVTRNVKDFLNFDSLSVENWFE